MKYTPQTDIFVRDSFSASELTAFSDLLEQQTPNLRDQVISKMASWRREYIEVFIREILLRKESAHSLFLGCLRGERDFWLPILTEFSQGLVQGDLRHEPEAVKKSLILSAKRPNTFNQVYKILGSRKILARRGSELQSSIVYGVLTAPIIVYRLSVDNQIPKVFFSIRTTLSEASAEDVINKIRGDGAALGLGFSTFYHNDIDSAASSNAGWGMADYQYVHKLRIESGTEIILSQFNRENEITIVHRGRVTILETKSI